MDLGTENEDKEVEKDATVSAPHGGQVRAKERQIFRGNFVSLDTGQLEVPVEQK